MLSTSAIRSKAGGKRICCRFWRERAHVALNSAELETVRVSKSPTTVVAANGEVHAKEEATVHVKELDFFVTVKLLDDTPTVLSHGNSAKITDILASGPLARSLSSLKMADG